VIYLDSSAILKLVRPEQESPFLVTWLNARSIEDVVTSKLAEVEVPRTLRRDEPVRLGATAGVLARLHRIELDDTIRSMAGAYPFPELRSPDAIHLATAEFLMSCGKTVSWFVSYHEYLTDIARKVGLEPAAPGPPPGPALPPGPAATGSR
jgi:hypothetical protein